MAEGQQQSLRLLAMGDSLTAGYYNCGRNFHPYGTHLSDLFSSVQIPVDVDQRGVIVAMVRRLETLLKIGRSYDWILILGGTNDLAFRPSAERIFKEGLELMYPMVLNQTPSWQR